MVDLDSDSHSDCPDSTIFHGKTALGQESRHRT